MMRKDGDAVLREKEFASEGVLELRSELNFPSKNVHDVQKGIMTKR